MTKANSITLRSLTIFIKFLQTNRFTLTKRVKCRILVQKMSPSTLTFRAA